MIDIRCGAFDPSLPPDDVRGRCQLAAGHEGEHALMYSDDGTRVVRLWTVHPSADASGDPAEVHEHRAGQEFLPWVRGMPRPAWCCVDVERAHVGGRATASR